MLSGVWFGFVVLVVVSVVLCLLGVVGGGRCGVFVGFFCFAIFASAAFVWIITYTAAEIYPHGDALNR